MNPSDLSGAELDARFFEVCWGGESACTSTARLHPLEANRHRHIYVKSGSELILVPPSMQSVSTDANACEAWAMRWSRQANLRYEICEMQDHVLVVLVNFERDLFEARGADWKQAFVRACVAAGEILKQAKGGA